MQTDAAFISLLHVQDRYPSFAGTVVCKQRSKAEARACLNRGSLLDQCHKAPIREDVIGGEQLGLLSLHRRPCFRNLLAALLSLPLPPALLLAVLVIAAVLVTDGRLGRALGRRCCVGRRLGGGVGNELAQRGAELSRASEDARPVVGRLFTINNGVVAVGFAALASRP